MDRAQDLHSKMHTDLITKGKIIANLEAKLAAQTAALAEAERKVERNEKKLVASLQEQDIKFAERLADLEDREESLTAAQEALAAAQAALEQQKADAASRVEAMETKVAEVEAAAMAMARERDAALASNATDLHQYHEQLISLSKNHLEQQNEDITRLAKLKQEKEEQRLQIAVVMQDQIVAMQRAQSELQNKYDTEMAAVREQMRQITARAAEDEARWSQQRQELEAVLATERADMAATCARITAGAQKETAMLASEIASNAKLVASLTAWEARRAAAEQKWTQTKEELGFMHRELQQSIARYEALEQSSSAALLQSRRDCDTLRAKLSESEAQLAKKSAALQVYHKEIRLNAQKMEEIKKLQAAQEKTHREQQEAAAKQVAAAQASAGRGNASAGGGGAAKAADQAQQGGGFSISGLFKSSSQKEAERAAAAAAVASAAAAASRRKNSEGPIRTISGADDEVNELNEEIGVSLSKRVESLEEERLALTAQLESTRKRLANTELLNQLLSEQRDPASKESAAIQAARAAARVEDSAASTAPGGAKKGLLSGFLSSRNKEAQSSLLKDPVRVRALLEESVVANQALSADAERSAAEIKRLRDSLAMLRLERDEALAAEKVSAAKLKARKSVAPSVPGSPALPESTHGHGTQGASSASATSLNHTAGSSKLAQLTPSGSDNELSSTSPAVVVSSP